MIRNSVLSLAVLVAMVQLAAGAVLHSSGPPANRANSGPGGADESVLENLAFGNDSHGFSASLRTGDRVADDFTVTGATGWDVQVITFYAYQTDSTTTPTIDGINLRIWDGPPGEPASTIVFGDTATNLLSFVSWARIFRVSEHTSGTGVRRPVMAVKAAVGTQLAAGTYWLDWQMSGSLVSGPWAVPISRFGQLSTGDGLRYRRRTGSWRPALDSGTASSQGFPFVIQGRGSCLASAIVPIAAVRGVRDGDDVVLVWDAESSSSSYNTWWVSGDPGGIPAAREAGPWPTVPGCDASSPESCRHVGGALGPGGDESYYQVRGVCGSFEGPE